MTSYLLDANALIALVVTEHEHHERAVAWVGQVKRFGLCPSVEGSLVRFLVRSGESARTARAILDALYATGRCDFWPDSLGYRDVDLDHVVGHRQVTDAYLASLANAAGAKLATFDRGLASALSNVAELII